MRHSHDQPRQEVSTHWRFSNLGTFFASAPQARIRLEQNELPSFPKILRDGSVR